MIRSPFIAEQERTCGACPEQHDGTLHDGRVFYLRMRYGRAELGITEDWHATEEPSAAGEALAVLDAAVAYIRALQGPGLASPSDLIAAVKAWEARDLVIRHG